MRVPIKKFMFSSKKLAALSYYKREQDIGLSLCFVPGPLYFAPFMLPNPKTAVLYIHSFSLSLAASSCTDTSQAEWSGCHGDHHRGSSRAHRQMVPWGGWDLQLTWLHPESDGEHLHSHHCGSIPWGFWTIQRGRHQCWRVGQIRDLPQGGR